MVCFCGAATSARDRATDWVIFTPSIGCLLSLLDFRTPNLGTRGSVRRFVKRVEAWCGRMHCADGASHPIVANEWKISPLLLQTRSRSCKCFFHLTFPSLEMITLQNSIVNSKSTHEMTEEERKEMDSQHVPHKEVSAMEDSSTKTKPPFKQRLKRHCARFWWLHFLIFAAVVLVTTLPV